MNVRQYYRAEELAGLAKSIRKASGKKQHEVARELEVSRPSVVFAENAPERNLLLLRKRIIDAYSPYTVSGPYFRLERKQGRPLGLVSGERPSARTSGLRR